MYASQATPTQRGCLSLFWHLLPFQAPPVPPTAAVPPGILPHLSST